MIRYFRFAIRFLGLSGFRPLFLFLPFLRSILDIFNASAWGIDRIIHSKYLKTKIENPVFILAFPRSGTTFLHRILPSYFPDFKGNQLMEMIFPAMTARAMLKPFRKRMDKMSDKMYDPKIHPTGLYSEETDDAAMFFRYFNGLFYWLNYTAWTKDMTDEDVEKSLVKACDKPKYYRYLEKLYKKKLYREGGQMLSKSFSFIVSYEKLKKQFPDGKFIFLLRDPAEAVPSCMSLVTHVQQGIHKFDKIKGERKTIFYRNIYRAALMFYRTFDELMEKGLEKDPQVIIIKYPELKNDYEALMKRVIDHCGLKAEDDLMKEIKDKAAKQKSYKSSHEYSPELFGISKEEIRKDFDFIYKKYFPDNRH